VSLVLCADPATLALRARLLARIRAFFAQRGVLEVETAALSPAAAPDIALDSVRAELNLAGPQTHYLHTSPEYAMKRLLAAGSGDIYQLCRVFRDGELGRWHQPEFTLLEWYRVGWSELELMVEVETLLSTLLADARPWGPSEALTYREAFVRHLDLDPLAGGDLAARLGELGREVPSGLDADALLDLAFATAVAPQFAPDALTFVTDFPASHAALARIKPGSPPVAARFEAFVGELELANGFAELTDPAEQRRRFEADLRRRRRDGRAVAPLDEAFLDVLAKVPACAGVALGVDRVVALAAGLDRLAGTLALAHETEPAALNP
jgi:elongation factor P--(R)-beta-lysine ligase